MGIFDRITRTVAEDNVVNIAEHQRAKPANYNVDRPLTAAARRLDLSSARERDEIRDRPFNAWQADAYSNYDAIGEVKYAFTLLAAVMSRLRLYPAIAVDPDAPPTSVTQLLRRENDQTAEEQHEDALDNLTIPTSITPEVMELMESQLEALGSGFGGMTGLIKQYTLNISIAGECYLVSIDNRWSLRSPQEIQARGSDGQLILKETRGSTALDRVLPEKTWIARIWRQHPRFSREPDSSMLALIEPCDELLTLQRMIRAIARSRMNAGMVFIPDGLSVAGGSVPETIEEAEAEGDQFLTELFSAITNPITNESASSTVVPLVVTGPEELAEKIKVFSFARESDRWLVERADKVLDRIMQGLDVPKDLVTGMASVKYSNAQIINEGMYKSHIEPLAVMLCDALTSVYLRPAVKSKFPDIPDDVLNQIVVWYDPTEVVIRPDPAEAATVGYENFLVSGDAWRRANGFSDTDAPTQSELALRMVLTKLNNLPPDTAALILQQALPTLFEGVDLSKVQPGAPEEKATKDNRFGAADAVSTDTFDDDSVLKSEES